MFALLKTCWKAILCLKTGRDPGLGRLSGEQSERAIHAPHKPHSVPLSEGGSIHAATQTAEIVKIVLLSPFERFVFVMSVLECYSPSGVLSSSLLLDCTGSDMIAARAWALQQIASFPRLPGLTIGRHEQSIRVGFGAVSPLKPARSVDPYPRNVLPRRR